MSKELQDIDCNCNNCKCLTRDIAKWNYWDRWHKIIGYLDFRRQRAKAFEDAMNEPTPEARKAMLYHAKKMKYQFDRIGRVNYGKCNKFDKEVSFLPDTCQIDTQQCFENRK